ncbi:hypothetical protein [Desulfatiferula olefinivorans]
MTTSGCHLDFFSNMVPLIRKMNRPVLMLPHGDCPHEGAMIMVGDISYQETDIYSPGALCDAVVVPNEKCAGRYTPHLPDDRICVLGSPRFNRQWLSALDDIVPPFDIKPARDSYKIALFLRNKAYPIFWEEIYWTIRLVTRFPSVHLTVIPHTRSEGWNELLDVYPELQGGIPNLTCTDDDVYSGSVVRWADAVMDIGTSMAFEAVMLGKTLICPEYLHATRSVCSTFFPNSVAWCRDDLYEKLTALIENPSSGFHSSDESARFIDRMVHVPDEHVLDRYVALLANTISQSAVLKESPPCRETHGIEIVNTGRPLIFRHATLMKAHEKLKRTHEIWVRNQALLIEKNNRQTELFEKLVQSPTDYFRFRRDRAFHRGDYDQALSSALSVLEGHPEAGDFERYYHIGLELHKRHDLDGAQAVYENVASDDRVGPELTAWALFKRGELSLDQGKQDEAQIWLRKALACNPNHTKALLYTVPQAGKLKVALGKSFYANDCIEIPMTHNDPPMWDYYFAWRKPDYIELAMDDPVADGSWPQVFALLKKHMAPGGAAMVRSRGMSQNRLPQTVVRAGTEYGLTVEAVSDGILSVKAYKSPTMIKDSIHG